MFRRGRPSGRLTLLERLSMFSKLRMDDFGVGGMPPLVSLIMLAVYICVVFHTVGGFSRLCVQKPKGASMRQSPKQTQGSLMQPANAGEVYAGDCRNGLLHPSASCQPKVLHLLDRQDIKTATGSAE